MGHKVKFKHWNFFTPELALTSLINMSQRVAPSMRTDVFIETWDSPLVRRIFRKLSEDSRSSADRCADESGHVTDCGITPVRPCRTRLEAYDEAYAVRVATKYPWVNILGGFLKIEDARETPHVVDFFYKRCVRSV